MAELTRRSFFQGAVYAAAATRVLGANDRVQMGIIGIGGRGTAHLKEYLGLPEARVVALCDVNQAAREKAQASVGKAGQSKAAEYGDMRALFDDKNVDAVSTATPNHWHALTTIWACTAGKDVYVEKPACHNVYEGQRMIDTARRYNRMVQVGSQGRSIPHKIRAVQLLNEGVIGKVYLSKGFCYKRRKSIGKTPAQPVPPPGIDWDMFLGPAPMRPFTMNRFKYNWHWFWDTGNGDIGNQGVHEMDIARWGLGVTWPKSVVCTGGKYVYDDDQETPNTQLASFDYGDKELQFEVRGILTAPDGGLPVKAGNTVGNLFLGADGWMWLDGDRFTVYKGESNEKAMEEKGQEDDETKLHMKNFLEAVKSRNRQSLHAEIEIGAMSADLCHLANISYRVGRKLALDGKGKFVADEEANKMLTRDYRKPYVV